MTSEENALMDAIANGKLSPTQRPGGRDYGRVFTGLLFAVFVLALLMAIFVGTGVYRSLHTMSAETDQARLSLSLIVNDVRANDAVDAVAVGTGPEGRSLVLVERLDSGTYETRLYLYQGNIVEEYSLTDAPYTPERATQIAPSGTFDFTYAAGLLTITTDQGSADVALRSVRGGA